MIPEIQAGQWYRHFKGNFYEVIAVALDHESEKELVIYRSCISDQIWSRPVDNWNESVEYNGKTVQRFLYCPDPAAELIKEI